MVAIMGQGMMKQSCGLQDQEHFNLTNYKLPGFSSGNSSGIFRTNGEATKSKPPA